MANTEAVIESGNRSCLTTITAFDFLKNFFEISIAVSILSLPAILAASIFFPVSGLEFGFFGSVPFAFSSTSVKPSLSSSGSVTSGRPSLSVSLWTVILKVFVVIVPVGSLASTVTINSLVSSPLPQSSILGLPVTFPFLYSTPFGRFFTPTLAFGLFVVIVTSAIGFPSITVWSTIGFTIVAGIELAFLGSDPFVFSSTSV